VALARLNRIGVAVGLPELSGGLYGPRGVASQMIVISNQGCQRPQYSNKHGLSITCSVNSSSKRGTPNIIMNFKPSVTTLRKLLHAADSCLPKS